MLQIVTASPPVEVVAEPREEREADQDGDHDVERVVREIAHGFPPIAFSRRERASTNFSYGS